MHSDLHLHGNICHGLVASGYSCDFVIYTPSHIFAAATQLMSVPAKHCSLDEDAGGQDS